MPIAVFHAPAHVGRCGLLRIPGTASESGRYTYRMPRQAYIVRVGGFAVALGVGAAIMSGWNSGVACADDSPGPAGSSASTNEGGPDAATAKPSAPADEIDSPGASTATNGFRRHARAPMTKSMHPGRTATASASGSGRDGALRSARPRHNAPDRAAAKPAKTRTPAPLSAVAEVKHDATPAVIAAAKQTTDAVNRPIDAVADAPKRPAGLGSLRTVSAQSPAVAALSQTEQSPRVVGVVSQLVSGVADAILTPFAASRTPGAPVDAPLAALLAFARREFESAVRSPSVTGTRGEGQTTSETLVADTAVKSEQRTLVLTAFPAEADAILARTTLDENPTVVVDGRHYYLGTLGGKKVIVAMTGIGMVNATDTTETALDHFTPESGISIGAVVFSGVAGGSGRTQIGSVAVPARWTSDDGATWHSVDSDMLAAANTLDVDLLSSDSIGDPACGYCGPLSWLPLINLNREPQLFVGGDGSSDDNNNGRLFPRSPPSRSSETFSAPSPTPHRISHFSSPATSFRRWCPSWSGGLLSNLIGLLAPVAPAVDAVDQETAAAQQVAEAHGVPFLGIRGMSDGPGDPLNLPGYPFTFFVYKQLAADNAAIVTEAFLQNWDGP